MLSPVENLPVTIFPNASINEFNKQLEEMDRNRERIVVTHQVTIKIILYDDRLEKFTKDCCQQFNFIYFYNWKKNSFVWNKVTPTLNLKSSW